MPGTPSPRADRDRERGPARERQPAGGLRPNAPAEP